MDTGPGGRGLQGSRLTRVAILGAGSIGCFVGGCWQLSGLDVRFFGRERLGADIGAHGLSLSDHSGWNASIPPNELDYRTDGEGLGDADIIALCVKSGATKEAAEQILRQGRAGALVISLQNGVSNVGLLEQRLSDRFTVVAGMVAYNVAYLGGGRFHKGVAGDIFVADCKQSRTLADAVRNSPASLTPSADMEGLAWGKLLINLNNAVNALSGMSLAEEMRQRDLRAVFAASMREGLRLLDRAGIRPARVGAVGPRFLPHVINSPDWLFNSIFMRSWKIDAKARSSMADDLAAGRLTEVDHINGELVRLAERLGQDAPINRRIVELVHQAERQASTWSPAGLRREVLG